MEFTYLGPKQNPTLVLPIRIDRNTKCRKGRLIAVLFAQIRVPGLTVRKYTLYFGMKRMEIKCT